MISTKDLVEKVNALILADGLSDLNYTQLSNIDEFLKNSVATVATLNDLPLASTNKGKMIFVADMKQYQHSNGVEWENIFDTTFYIKSDVYGWGENGQGHLGDNTVIDKSSPVSPVGGITNWTQITGSGYHALALTSDGIAYAWGDALAGKLGDNSTADKSSPVTVVGGITNWSQLSAAVNHSLGVTKNGIAYAWGFNGAGHLGDGTNFSRRSPVTVIGGITNWSQVSAGGAHSLGIAGGIAYAWGGGFDGVLGDGTATNKTSPVTVIGGITNWSQVSAGGAHSLGIAGGIAYAWGGGFDGVLGDGTATNKTSPVTVIGGITNWSQVSGGEFHSVGIADGIAYAWGRNVTGQVGDGTTVNKSSPVTVLGDIANWSQVSAGDDHVVGVTEDGIAYAWGSGNFGMLGDNSTINKSSPVTVVGGITNWSQVNAGGFHSLGLTSDGIAYAWGAGATGRLGNNSNVNRSSPVTPVGGIANWTQVNAARFHSSALSVNETKGFDEA